jgi:predicted RNA-binding Zn ribbon-like protein
MAGHFDANRLLWFDILSSYPRSRNNHARGATNAHMCGLVVRSKLSLFLKTLAAGQSKQTVAQASLLASLSSSAAVWSTVRAPLLAATDTATNMETLMSDRLRTRVSV